MCEELQSGTIVSKCTLSSLYLTQPNQNLQKDKVVRQGMWSKSGYIKRQDTFI